MSRINKNDIRQSSFQIFFSVTNFWNKPQLPFNFWRIIKDKDFSSASHNSRSYTLFSVFKVFCWNNSWGCVPFFPACRVKAVPRSLEHAYFFETAKTASVVLGLVFLCGFFLFMFLFWMWRESEVGAGSWRVVFFFLYFVVVVCGGFGFLLYIF